MKSEALPHVKLYMSIFKHTGGCDNLIALWSSKSSKAYADIGDIGCFDRQGRFHTFFNLYLDREGNIAREHEPPDYFESFSEPNSGPLVPAVDHRSKIRLHQAFETSAGSMSSQFIST